jgi:hypothetical protein
MTLDVVEAAVAVGLEEVEPEASHAIAMPSFLASEILPAISLGLRSRCR